MNCKNVLKISKEIVAVVTIDVEPRFYNKRTKTFSMELSDIDLGSAPYAVKLKNPKTKNEIEFKMFKKDMDASNEDVYGYWYQSNDRKFKLLLIND